MDSIALKSTQFALNSRNCLRASDNGCKYPYSSSSFSCLLPSFSHKLSLGGNSAIVAAAKKENKPNKRRKEDSHSFIPKPDESTGPFPEAVLLKEVIFICFCSYTHTPIFCFLVVLMLGFFEFCLL